MYDKTSALMQRGREFLGTDHAILCGAMSWVSERNLVSAISNAGAFGVRWVENCVRSADNGACWVDFR